MLSSSSYSPNFKHSTSSTPKSRKAPTVPGTSTLILHYSKGCMLKPLVRIKRRKGGKTKSKAQRQRRINLQTGLV